MYGHLNVIIKSFLDEKFREETCREILKKAACPRDLDSHKLYDDHVTERLIDAATSTLAFPKDTFLQMLGEFYLEYLRETGHEELLRNLGENMLDFIENLDYIHTYMMSEYPDVNMPSFRCETDSQKDRITLHYYSFRSELHPLVMGILRSAAKIFFKSSLDIQVISKMMENVGSPLGMRQHVVLAIVVVATRLNGAAELPPTFVAQTKKHCEKQILKTDIDHVLERLDEIRRDQGEEALPLNRRKVVQGKWKAVAKMSALYGGFVPQYPKSLFIDPKTFCNTFPYHIAFDENMTIIHSGVKIQQLMPSIRTPVAKANDFFDLLHPHSMTFTYNNVKKFINTPFVLKTLASKMVGTWGKRPMLILRGEMIHVISNDKVIYLCSPFVRCLGDLEQRSMHVADIPIHDVTRDMLWAELMSRHREAIETGDTDKPGGCPIIVHTSPLQHLNPDDPEVLRAELQRLQAELAAEKERNGKLHRAFLPSTVANQIMTGQTPEAGVFRNVTVLFADVVAFASILSHCAPHDLVKLLTQLHRRFDRLCRVNGVDRVDAVADAYMVVSGVPDSLSTHAERIANTALGMLLVAREVASPYDYGDQSKHVQIRIGIHSGKVVAGVVGEALPHFLIMGEAVNMASKMESHGQPDRAHISDVTYSLLRKKNYRVEKRGRIDIRGYGQMTSYFLVGNESLSANQLLGKPPRLQDNGNEVTFINEGHVEEPPPGSSISEGSRSMGRSSNKVSPLSGAREGEIVPISYSDAPRSVLLQPIAPNTRLH